jgi:hypothetical protein
MALDKISAPITQARSRCLIIKVRSRESEGENEFMYMYEVIVSGFSRRRLVNGSIAFFASGLVFVFALFARPVSSSKMKTNSALDGIKNDNRTHKHGTQQSNAFYNKDIKAEFKQKETTDTTGPSSESIKFN